MAVRSVAAAHVLHALGQDANDTVRFSGKTNRTSDDGGIAVESTHPQLVAEDHDVAVGRNFVSDFEITPDRRLIAKYAEEPCRDLHPSKLLRPVHVADLQIAALIGGNPFERLELVAIVAEVCWRHRKMRRAIGFLEQPHEPFRMWVWQR